MAALSGESAAVVSEQDDVFSYLTKLLSKASLYRFDAEEKPDRLSEAARDYYEGFMEISRRLEASEVVAELATTQYGFDIAVGQHGRVQYKEQIGGVIIPRLESFSKFRFLPSDLERVRLLSGLTIKVSENSNGLISGYCERLTQFKKKFLEGMRDLEKRVFYQAPLFVRARENNYLTQALVLRWSVALQKKFFPRTPRLPWQEDAYQRAIKHFVEQHQVFSNSDQIRALESLQIAKALEELVEAHLQVLKSSLASTSVSSNAPSSSISTEANATAVQQEKEVIRSVETCFVEAQQVQQMGETSDKVAEHYYLVLQKILTWREEPNFRSLEPFEWILSEIRRWMLSLDKMIFNCDISVDNSIERAHALKKFLLYYRSMQALFPSPEDLELKQSLDFFEGELKSLKTFFLQEEFFLSSEAAWHKEGMECLQQMSLSCDDDIIEGLKKREKREKIRNYIDEIATIENTASVCDVSSIENSLRNDDELLGKFHDCAGYLKYGVRFPRPRTINNQQYSYDAIQLLFAIQLAVRDPRFLKDAIDCYMIVSLDLECFAYPSLLWGFVTNVRNQLFLVSNYWGVGYADLAHQMLNRSDFIKVSFWFQCLNDSLRLDVSSLNSFLSQCPPPVMGHIILHQGFLSLIVSLLNHDAPYPIEAPTSSQVSIYIQREHADFDTKMRSEAKGLRDKARVLASQEAAPILEKITAIESLLSTSPIDVSEPASSSQLSSSVPPGVPLWKRLRDWVKAERKHYAALKRTTFIADSDASELFESVFNSPEGKAYKEHYQGIFELHKMQSQSSSIFSFFSTPDEPDSPLAPVLKDAPSAALTRFEEMSEKEKEGELRTSSLIAFHQGL